MMTTRSRGRAVRFMIAVLLLNTEGRIRDLRTISSAYNPVRIFRDSYVFTEHALFGWSQTVLIQNRHQRRLIPPRLRE